VSTAGRGRRREVPGGDPAVFVRQALRGADGVAPVPGRMRLQAPAATVAGRIPARYATVEPDGDDACIVTTTNGWSTQFVVWMATLDVAMEALEPPELVEQTRTIAARLGAAA
jgi:hypothetical protein